MSTQIQVVGDTCKRASTEGPDYCATCSALLGDWVQWEGHTHREAALIADVRHRLREYGEDPEWRIFAALKSALERTEANLMHSIRGHPVRDLAENLAENETALAMLQNG